MKLSSLIPPPGQEQVRTVHHRRARGAAPERVDAPHRRDAARQGHRGGARAHHPRRRPVLLRGSDRDPGAPEAPIELGAVLRGRIIVVGVSGGIAAYKACELVRRLRDARRRGDRGDDAGGVRVRDPAHVRGALGQSGRARRCGATSARSSSCRSSRAPRLGGRVEHVDVAEVADCVVIAPATADLMARLVHGEAPDALTCLVLATRAPLVVAPGDGSRRCGAPSRRGQRARAARAAARGIVDPETGALASGLAGPGRLAEIADIVEAVERAVERRASLKGVRVLVSAGRTEEPLDPVRVLTNRSSGRMGFALAEAARDRGADVTLVAGPVSVEPPHGVTLERVTTARRDGARAAGAAAARAIVVLMAAAVADYRPATAVAREAQALRGAAHARAHAQSRHPRGPRRRAPAPGRCSWASRSRRRTASKHARDKLRGEGRRPGGAQLARGRHRHGHQSRHAGGRERRRRAAGADKRDVAEAILDRVIALRAATRSNAAASRARAAREARARGGASRARRRDKVRAAASGRRKARRDERPAHRARRHRARRAPAARARTRARRRRAARRGRRGRAARARTALPSVARPRPVRPTAARRRAFAPPASRPRPPPLRTPVVVASRPIAVPDFALTPPEPAAAPAPRAAARSRSRSSRCRRSPTICGPRRWSGVATRSRESSQPVLDEVAKLARACTKCGLSTTRTQRRAGRGLGRERHRVRGRGAGRRRGRAGRAVRGPRGPAAHRHDRGDEQRAS